MHVFFGGPKKKLSRRTRLVKAFDKAKTDDNLDLSKASMMGAALGVATEESSIHIHVNYVSSAETQISRSLLTLSRTKVTNLQNS